MRPIVIAAGGTGGHFFPAEALALELFARGHRVVLMTDRRAMAKLPESLVGREIHVLPGAGIAGRGVRRAAAAVARLAAGTAKARLLLNQLDPAAIVAFGGYPSIPPVLATMGRKAKPAVILHEQNAVLGRANRLLSGRAKLLALSFAQTFKVPRDVPTTVVGNPVRPEFVASVKPWHGDGDGLNLLVLGGSLGARIFADAVPAAIATLPETLRARLRITQQCRPEDLPRVGQAYAALGLSPELSPFFTDIPTRLAAASLVIARAGASTVAELAVAGRPAILVPLPGAIDDHQAANARALADAGAAWIVPQSSIATLGPRLAALLADPAALENAGRTALSLAKPDAAARLADLVLAQAGVAA